MTSLLISEIYGPVIQGEGTLIGKPSVFIRFGGCDFRCSWCDSLYAVLPEHKSTWQKMPPADIIEQVQYLTHNTPCHITLTGGNPAMQDCTDLIQLGKDSGYTFAIETQGSMYKDWFKNLDQIILSPKPPSSGEKTYFDILEKCISDNVIFKIVIFDLKDYDYAIDIHEKYPKTPMYFQAGTEQDAVNNDNILNRFKWVSDKVINDGYYNIHVLPQLHVLAWGAEREK